MVDERLPRLERKRRIVVAICGKPAGHGSYDGGAHSDDETQEVRVSIVLACCDGAPESWPVNDRNQGVEACHKVIQHP
jgi:hypothetical protein